MELFQESTDPKFSKNNHREQENVRLQLNECRENLSSMRQTHKQTLASLQQQQADQLESKESQFMEEIRELDGEQELEMLELKKKQLTEIQQMTLIQQKEMELQQVIHETELKAILERKVLNGLLDTILDGKPILVTNDTGIICVDTQGYIQRFNKSAEIMFGYSSVCRIRLERP
jgi:PAS domain-containing protein